VSKLAAILLIFLVFAASSQCLADCFGQKPIVPSCHRHSQSKTPAPDHCSQTQLAAYAQVAPPPAIETPILTATAFEFLTPQAQAHDSAAPEFNVLRL
jgi:hypothetical protein